MGVVVSACRADFCEKLSTLRDIDATSKKAAESFVAIDGIAFRTHSLALNAAVQAARRRAGPWLRHGFWRGAGDGKSPRCSHQGNQLVD